MQDNIKECRLRLLKTIKDNGTKITEEHVETIFTNIVCTPLNKYPNGSLDYVGKKDAFTNKPSKKDVTRWMEGIENNRWLELVGNENINAIIRNDIEPSFVSETFGAFFS